MTTHFKVLTTILGLMLGQIGFVYGDTLLTFEKDIRPILKQHCTHCHGEEPKPKGKLDVRTVKVMLQGGRNGTAIVPGNPDESLLWTRVESDEMPEGHKKVPPAQKAILKRWIEQGAKTARAEPDDPNQAKFTDEELNHWAWRVPERPTIPHGMPKELSPIDAFLLAKIKQAGLSGFSPPVDRRTLIRRATFDLHGLPPTPEEVEQFVNDSSPDAYGKLLDRLLASPRYGERWGRHWLDVAGYAETDTPRPNSAARPYAWQYRDYVIRSFNADKPYSQFVIEQLAGDELAASQGLSRDNPAAREQLAATGFLFSGPDNTEQDNSRTERNEAVAEMLKITSTSLLGLTVGCAQCHDHKYDPIPIEDYYRLRAVFGSAFHLDHWRRPSERLIHVTPADKLAAIEKAEAEWKKDYDQLQADKRKVADAVFERELNRVPESDRVAVRAAIGLDESARSPEQQRLLTKYPNVKPIIVILHLLVEYDKVAHAEFAKREEQLNRRRVGLPPREYLTAVANVNEAPPAQIFLRGDPSLPGRAVTPGEIFVLDRGQAPPIPAAATQRRLAYAQWLTSGRHPLTARVIVNRIWQHHFGQGLVRTPNDFGLNGSRPTHPELLDWLAIEFVQGGWRMKAFHKQLMLTQAYQQSARRSPELNRIDPENRLLARFNLRRLDAESLRDSILFVSGKLNEQQFGPSVPLYENSEGLTVFGRQVNLGNDQTLVLEVGPQALRRSIYLEHKRHLPLPVLDAFDLPVMTPNCAARRCSTVAPQSLMLLNDRFVVEQAEELAERLHKAAPTIDQQLALAFRLLYAAELTDHERKTLTQFFEQQKEYFRTHGDEHWKEMLKKYPHGADLRALASLCQTLLCSNRFLYVE